MSLNMNREEITSELMRIFSEEFEIENPGLDEDLSQKYEFDSIDAIELLVAIEQMLGVKLSQNEKKQAMGIRTINQICDYIESLLNDRNPKQDFQIA
jgi:acyl carrier protein